MATRSIHNSAVSLDQAKCQKSRPNSVGEVGGSLTVVPPVCTIVIDEIINDGKFTDVNQLKQFQGTQICKIAEEPLFKEAEEPQEPGDKAPQEPGSKELRSEHPQEPKSKEPRSKQPQEPGSKAPQEPGSKEPRSKAPQEPGSKEPRSKQPQEPGSKAPQEPGSKEPGSKAPQEPGSKEPRSKQPQEPGSKEPRSKQPQKPGSKEPQKPGSKEPQEQGFKELEEPVSKKAEEPDSEILQKPGSKEPEEPVSKETEEPGSEEPQEPVSREADEPVSKEQDTVYCVSRTVPEQETTDNVSSALMDVGSTEFTEQEKFAGEDVSHRSNSSNTEETESTKMTRGDNITSEQRDHKSESVDPIASQNSRNLDIEKNLNPIMYSSTDYELENTESDENLMATSSAYDRKKFEDDFESNVKPKLESGNEYVANNTAGAEIDSNSHGNVDGFIPKRPVSNNCETDQSNTDNKDDLDMIKLLNAEKMRLLVDDIVGKTKVVYKLYNGCSCNTNLQVVFIFAAVLQSLISDHLQTESIILKHFCAAFDQTFSDIGEHFVFAATFRFLDLPDQFLFDLPLPDPNLPGIVITNYQNIFNATLGVALRQAHADTPNSEEDGELRDSFHTPPDSDVFSTLNDHPREAHSLQDSFQQNRTEFISILSAPLSVTIREVNENSQGVTAARVENVPELQTPRTEQLGLDVDNTNRKIRNVDENLTNIGPTGFSQDGNPTTLGNRKNEIPRVGNHGQDADSISGVTSQLSSSVSTHSIFPPNDHLTTVQNRMTNMQARANTFDGRWPHSHLTADKMAEAGFYFTGERDATRCFWCDICLRQWEIDDDPLVEHVHHSPECEYIQNLLQDNAQNFGASNENDVAQVRNTLPADDRQNGAYGSVQSQEGGFGDTDEMYRYALHTGQNGQPRLEIEMTNRAGEQTHSTPSPAERGHTQVGRRGRHYPYGEQEGNHDDRNHSETIVRLSCEGNSHQAESSGIQETRYVSCDNRMTPHPQELYYQTPQDFVDHGLGAAGPYEMLELEDQGSPTTAAIDREMVIMQFNSNEVRMVLSEGYSWTDTAYAVEAILRADGIITVDTLRHELSYIGARPQV